MEIILKFKTEDKSTIEEKLNEDPFGRQSFSIKEPKILGFEDEGLYVYFKGNDEVCGQLKEALADLVETPKNEEEIIQKLKEEEAAANAGMGAIFS